jgi:hypothetical protein
MVVSFEAEAYTALMLHCYKHPSQAVNGVLLGRESSPGSLQIVKAVPLFHGILSLLPMLEAAMLQVSAQPTSVRHLRPGARPEPAHRQLV